MKLHLTILLATCAAFLVSPVQARRVKTQFKPMIIENLEPRPDFWKVRPDEISELCKNLSKGHSEIIARTPKGYPVWAVFFGDFSDSEPQTNWSAGNSSSSMNSYLTDKGDIQTIVLLAGIHGSEPESVAGAMNVIKLLDTGADFRGKSNPELLALASKYRIIVVPCANMDGRSLSPDHLRGQPYEVFRAACQGTWKDGSLVGWRGSKEWFPLPLEKVSFPGGYPNGEGYNIQHDCTPGDIRTAEMAALCRLFARWKVDFVLNGHSCEYQPHMMAPSQVNTDAHIKTQLDLYDRINTAFLAAGLRTRPREKDKVDTRINLDNLVGLCSGGIGMTLECSSSYDNIHRPTVCYSFEELMEPFFIAFRIVMEYGLDHSLASRRDS